MFPTPGENWWHKGNFACDGARARVGLSRYTFGGEAPVTERLRGWRSNLATLSVPDMIGEQEERRQQASIVLSIARAPRANAPSLAMATPSTHT